MDRMHFSTAQCFENCPARWKFRYQEGLETAESDDPANALKIGTCFHRGMETDADTAITEYLMSYPIITDEHINEAIKLRHWIARGKEIVPEGLHEVPMRSDWYEGTMDLLVPKTKHDLHITGGGEFDLYDYKYSNNQEHYMESEQLHVYKYFCEQITGRHIRKMFFVFVPKISIKQKKDESILQFRARIMQEMEQKDIEIREVVYDPGKVLKFFNTAMSIQYAEKFPKNVGYLCRWCEYENYCLKGDKTMLLPKNERREAGAVKKRKLWIYGQPFSGKTTFLDSAPDPLNLNTDGNIQFVTMPYVAIKDTREGRQKVFAWENFKEAIAELQADSKGFRTVIVDLLDDMYQACRVYMYDRLGISHESDDSFKAWDQVRSEFLNTLKDLFNLDVENIVIVSHEDMSKDITRRSGDKITAIKPNIPEKVANKVAGMVDIVARIVVEDDGKRTLNFKSNEVVFGGGRLTGLRKNCIPLDWDQLCNVYAEALGKGAAQNAAKPEEASEEPKRKPRQSRAGKVEEPEEEPLPFEVEDKEETNSEPEPAPAPEPVSAEEEKPRRRTRRVRTEE